MKIKFIIIVLIFCTKIIIAQDYLTKEIIRKVVYLKYNNKTASGFFIKSNNKTYLITAKHFVDSINKVKKLVEIQSLYLLIKIQHGVLFKERFFFMTIIILI